MRKTSIANSSRTKTTMTPATILYHDLAPSKSLPSLKTPASYFTQRWCRRCGQITTLLPTESVPLSKTTRKAWMVLALKKSIRQRGNRLECRVTLCLFHFSSAIARLNQSRKASFQWNFKQKKGLLIKPCLPVHQITTTSRTVVVAMEE